MANHRIARKNSQIVRQTWFSFNYPSVIYVLIGNFIDDDTPVASGSGTQHHTSWNTFQNGEDLDDFFDQIYQRSRRLGTRPMLEDAADFRDDLISRMPGDNEYPLWRIGCRVRF